MDWDDLRFLLAVARHGSQSAAARALGVTQPTVGRRMGSLQRDVGARLFERAAGVLHPTAVCRAMVEEARRVEERVLRAERIVRSGAAELAGHVRITASDWLVTRVLPAVISAAAASAPGLRVDLEAAPRLASLVRNEADLAIRPARFEDNSVWQRAVGFAEFAVYASAPYLEDRGLPSLAAGCEGHDVILMDDDAGAVADVAWLRRTAARARIRARVNGREPMAALAAAHAGLACLPTLVGDGTPGLVRIAALQGAPGRTLWLGAHRDRRDLVRVRSVAELVRRAVGAALPASPARAT